MTTTETAMTPEELVAKLDALDDETMCFDGLATYALIREAAGMIRTLRQQKEDASLAATGLRIKAVQDRAKIDALKDQLETTEEAFRAADVAAAAKSMEQRQEIERLTVVNNAYVDLAGELIRATGTDNVVDALNAAVEHLEAAQ